VSGVTRQGIIEEKLTAALAPVHLEVTNESHNHSVRRGSETHFKVVVVSSAFEGMSRVERHRRVNDLLADLMATGLHALTITPRTPSEWAKSTEVLASPPCLGGSKSSASSGGG
jgi:BolA protein